MGGLSKALFGGSSQKSSSGNSAFEQLRGLLSGNIGQGNSAMSTIGGLLGIGSGEDKAAASGAFENYLDNSGFAGALNRGIRGVTGTMASKGLLRSGTAGKAFTDYELQKKKETLGDYVAMMSNLGQYGLNSAQIVSGAGQFSKGKGGSHTGVVNSLFG